MNRSILIVIDMQEKFLAAREPITVANCKKLILDFQKQINPILFVEYRWNGPTLPSLTALVEKYSFKDSVTKEEDDGSSYIVNYFKRCKINPTKLIICGVNTEYCVHDTVIGLFHHKKFDITVVKDACGSQWGTVESAEKLFKKMRQLGVKVI